MGGFYDGAGDNGGGSPKRTYFRGGTYVVELQRIVAKVSDNKKSKTFGQNCHIGEFLVLETLDGGTAANQPGTRVSQFEVLERVPSGALTGKGEACMNRVSQFFAATFGVHASVGAAAQAAQAAGHQVPNSREDFKGAKAALEALTDSSGALLFPWVTGEMIEAAIGEDGQALKGLRYRVVAVPKAGYTAYDWELLK